MRGQSIERQTPSVLLYLKRNRILALIQCSQELEEAFEPSPSGIGG
jgi:hypothetical protein